MLSNVVLITTLPNCKVRVHWYYGQNQQLDIELDIHDHQELINLVHGFLIGSMRLLEVRTGVDQWALALADSGSTLYTGYSSSLDKESRNSARSAFYKALGGRTNSYVLFSNDGSVFRVIDRVNKLITEGVVMHISNYLRFVVGFAEEAGIQITVEWNSLDKIVRIPVVVDTIEDGVDFLRGGLNNEWGVNDPNIKCPVIKIGKRVFSSTTQLDSPSFIRALKDFRTVRTTRPLMIGANQQGPDYDSKLIEWKAMSNDFSITDLESVLTQLHIKELQ